MKGLKPINAGKPWRKHGGEQKSLGINVNGVFPPVREVLHWTESSQICWRAPV
jgi:hypothetical protein